MFNIMAKLSIFYKINVIAQIFLFLVGMTIISMNEVESSSYPRTKEITDNENVQFKPLLSKLIEAYRSGLQTWKIYEGKIFKITGSINYIEKEEYKTSIVMRTRFPAFNPKFQPQDSIRERAFWLGKGQTITLVCVAKGIGVEEETLLGDQCLIAN